MKILSLFKKSSPRTSSSSDFSVFFREASSGKKKAVFMDVARKASADQRQVIETARKANLTTV
jgi:hypothetical protein